MWRINKCKWNLLPEHWLPFYLQQVHYIEHLKHIFPEMKLRGLIPNFYIHVSCSDLYIPMISLPICYFLILYDTHRLKSFSITSGLWPRTARALLAPVCLSHKVLTYVEYRAVPGVVQNIDPPPPSPPSECVPSSPRSKAEGTQTLAGRRRGWGGLIFWKTPAIGIRIGLL
jgi:hypothetical protein